MPNKDLEIIKKAFIISTVALLSIILILEINPFFKPYMRAANLGIQDILVSRFSTNKIAHKDIVVVTIDDKTLSDNEP